MTCLCCPTPVAEAQPLATLREHSAQLIRETLEQHGGNVSQSARALGISRGTLYRRLRGQPTRGPELLRDMFEKLGGSFLKFGQILSTRPDIVGEEMAEQLKYLQDQLPPFPTDTARAIVAARTPASSRSCLVRSQPVAALTSVTSCSGV